MYYHRARSVVSGAAASPDDPQPNDSGPVDVRKVDLSGNPIVDLKKEDFSLTENGTSQEIRLFDAHALSPSVPVPGAPLLRKAVTADAPLAAQNQRIFLFVFGRGRLQWPDKGSTR